MKERYALYDDEGRCWWFHLGSVTGQPMLGEIALEQGAPRNWWRLAVDGEPAAVAEQVRQSLSAGGLIDPPFELLQEGRRVVSEYRLTVEVPGWSPVLSVSEWNDMTDDESETFDRRAVALYEAVYMELPAERIPLEDPPEPWLVLLGEPPPDDGLTWVARLPRELANRPEYAHLLPGHLVGFREALVARLSALENVDAYGSPQRPVSVFLKVEIDRLEPVLYQAPPHKGMKGNRLRERSTITRNLLIPADSVITGGDRVEAVQIWNAKMDEIVGYVAGLVAHPCPTCGGRAWVEPAKKEGDA